MNDGISIAKTVSGSEITGKQILQCICEINGAIGVITKSNKFRYIVLPQPEMQGRYPSENEYPAEDEYPSDPMISEYQSIGIDQLKKVRYENYDVQQIEKVQVRFSENDIGAIAGTGENTYIVEDNFLILGFDATQLRNVANNLLNAISFGSFKPFDAQIMADPCLELGDMIQVFTKEEVFISYVLESSIEGITTLDQKISAKGDEFRSEKVNGIARDLIRLRGKTNELQRDVEQTKSTITDVEAGLQSQITQQAGEINAKVSQTGGNTSFSWSLTSTAFELKSSNSTVFKCNSSGIEINGKVTAKEGFIGNGSNGFAIGNTSISNGTNSMTSSSEGIYIGTDGINLGGNFKVTKKGELTAVSGYIGSATDGFNIASKGLYAGRKSSFSADSSAGVYIGSDGISVGAYGFKASESGISIGGSSGATSIELWGGIVFKNSLGGSISVGNSERIKFGTTSTDFDGQEVVFKKDIELNQGSSTFSITSKSDTSWYLGTNDWRVRRGSSTSFDNVLSYAYSGSTLSMQTNVKIGASDKTIGFFGGNGDKKKTVNKLATSATLATTITKINDLLSALSAYGLITSS